MVTPGPGPILREPEELSVADHRMIGKMGRVTGTVAPGRLGEVMVQVRGGSEAFHAYAADNDDTIPVGSRIVVVEYFPPRTVVVTRM
jgi:membrane protein implicated in regulation of membrane protease activity